MASIVIKNWDNKTWLSVTKFRIYRNNIVNNVMNVIFVKLFFKTIMQL